MARHSFGGDLAAWTFSVGSGNAAVLTGAATITFWNAQTGGTQYTTLASDAAGTTIVDHVTSSTGSDGLTIGQIPVFYGPDGVVAMWASAAGGPRALVLATDTPTLVVSNSTAISGLTGQLGAHTTATNPHSTHLTDLLDTNLPAVSDGQLLGYDLASQKWHAVTVAGVSGTASTGAANTWTKAQTIGPMSPGDVNAIRLLMYAESAGMVANMMECWSGADVGQGGARQKTTYFNEKGELRVIPARFDSVAVRIKAQPSQTAHITEWTDTGNNPLAWVESDGRVRAPNAGFILGPFSITGTVAAGTGKHAVYNDTGTQLTIRSVRANVGTAPTGAAMICDVLKGGTSIFSSVNRPTIAAGATTSGKVTAIATTTINDGEFLTMNVAQVGSTVAGSDLVVQVQVY